MWNSIPNPPTYVPAIAAIDAKDVWAVGVGVHHHDGTGWTEVLPTPTDENLWSVWANAADDVW